jgi:hypothetical protein
LWVLCDNEKSDAAEKKKSGSIRIVSLRFVELAVHLALRENTFCEYTFLEQTFREYTFCEYTFLEYTSFCEYGIHFAKCIGNTLFIAIQS